MERRRRVCTRRRRRETVFKKKKTCGINVLFDCSRTATLGQGAVQYVCFGGSEVKWQNHIWHTVGGGRGRGKEKKKKKKGFYLFHVFQLCVETSDRNLGGLRPCAWTHLDCNRSVRARVKGVERKVLTPEPSLLLSAHDFVFCVRVC